METRETITLNTQAQRRLLVLTHLLAGELSGEEAAGMCGSAPSGACSSSRIDDATRGRLVELATTRYGDINRAHLADLLAGPRGHRLRRERMSRAGLLLQVDGNRHGWLEGRGPWLTIVGAIDDATGIVTGATFPDQGTPPATSRCSSGGARGRARPWARP